MAHEITILIELENKCMKNVVLLPTVLFAEHDPVLPLVLPTHPVLLLESEIFEGLGATVAVLDCRQHEQKTPNGTTANVSWSH